MALPPNLPPQAYTRDTLVKAIEWLTTQPAAVRERANSADLIVSHYLASRRRTPFSGESAAADLRSLADDLRPTITPPPAPSAAPAVPAPEEIAPALPARTPDPETRVGPARGTPEDATSLVWSVDARSHKIAREVQDRMNLSSESEALRMLVAMGAERLRSVLP